MNRPLPAITISFITGIILNTIWGFVPGVLILSTMACVIAVLIGYFFARWDNRWVFAALFILLGWFTAGVDGMQHPNGPERFAGHFVNLDGLVTREPDVRENYTNYVLATEAVWLGEQRVPTRGLVLIRVYDSGAVYSYGDRLRVQGLLYTPEEPGNFGAFNYRAYLARRGIYCLIRVDKPDHVQLLGVGGNAAIRLALQSKASLLQVAAKTMDERQTAVLAGLLFGNQGNIDQSVKDVFALTGVTHVLSVSGLHMAYVVAGVLLVAGALRLPRRAVPALALVVVLFYTVMTGMGPPVVRSGIMAMLVLMAVQLGREKDWPSALALAALVILLFDPSACMK